MLLINKIIRKLANKILIFAQKKQKYRIVLLGTDSVGDVRASLPGHVGPILSDTDIQMVAAAPPLRETPLCTAGAPSTQQMVSKLTRLD